MDLRTNPQVTVRGLRNNNPFNMRKTSIQWQGKTKGADPSFETFTSVESGIRAGMIDIINDIMLKKLITLNSLFAQFAPPTENDTTAYIQHVATITGVSPEAKLIDDTNKLNPVFLNKLAVAIITQENGAQSKAIDADTIQKGVLSALEAPQIKKYINSTTNGFTSNSGVLNDIGGLVFILVVLFAYFLSLK